MALAVVTSLFNCTPHSVRHRHYKTFRHTIGDVPLYTVELAFDDLPFVLSSEECTLQLRSNAWMWQRDRIVNKLLELVPKEYNNIALIDADLFFHNPNWIKDTEDMLTQCCVGQMWEHCHHTHENIPADRGISNRDIGTVHTGYAWAFRRDFLEEFGLFDTSIVGGNDVFMTAAYCGWFKHHHFNHHTPQFLDHFSKWANRVFKATKGDVGYVKSDITHMWHGPKQARNYIGRIELMNDYDPECDIEIDESGCWRWATDKPELHQGVKAYMKTRMEG